MTAGTGGTSNSMRPHIDQITAAIPRELGTRQDDKKSIASMHKAGFVVWLQERVSFEARKSAGVLIDGNGARIVADAIKPLIIEIAILTRQINELRSKVK